MTSSEAVCRSCGAPLMHSVVDLGLSPVSNNLTSGANLLRPEVYYPLVVMVCDDCGLVQTLDFTRADKLFDDDYIYFSSYSESWLRHAEIFSRRMVEELSLGAGSMVVEVASNDGYLLQYFASSGVRVLGIEPTGNTAAAAEALRQIPTKIAFFNDQTAKELAAEGVAADLIVANNVLAHVPEPNDFVAGFRRILKPSGIVSFEFPHLLNLVEQKQFDTIYHEHFSYLSLKSTKALLERHGLRIFRVENLATHGGSLRVYARHAAAGGVISPSVEEILARERDAGLDRASSFASFQADVERIKDDFVSFLVEAKRSGKTVLGYGAPAKASTLLNYCGVKSDLLPFTVDRSPHKAGKFIPGVRVPIFNVARLAAARPDYVVIFPWNLASEIAGQMEEIRSWGGKFVTAIPELKIF